MNNFQDLKKQLDDAERVFNKFRQQHNTVDVTKESELYLTQSITLETKRIELQQQQADLAAKSTQLNIQRCVKLMLKLLQLINKLVI